MKKSTKRRVVDEKQQTFWPELAGVPLPETGWQMPTGFPSLQGQGLISLDVETYDPQLKTRGSGAFRNGFICGVSVGTEGGFRQYFPIRHQLGENLDPQKVFAWLRQELRSPVPKIGANLIYDLGYLAAEGVEVTGPYYDVQICEPLLDENRLSYSLESIAQHWLKEGKKQNVMRDWLVLAFGEANYKSNIHRAPASVVGPYAESDVDLPLRIFALQRAELESRGLWDLFVMESKLIPMLLAMWRRGVRVDVNKAEQLYDRLSDQQTETIAEIKRQTGIEPDIWAAASLAKIFDAADISYELAEKTGAPSFRKDWLENCTHPVGKLITQARRLDKFKGTFIRGFIIEGNTNGFVHCQFNSLKSDEGGTVSGRFSSSKPNLQQIPVRDKLGKEIRSIFVAEKSKRWWKFDFSQIEFRLAIHHAARLELPGAQEVVDAYINDPSTDYHQVVAGITGVSRSEAKSINFGIIYGLGLPALADQLGIDVATAKTMYDSYLSRVPFVGRLRGKAMEAAAKDGVITTMLGRQRHFDMWERGGEVRPYHFSGARRAFTHKALNSKLQGDASDVLKLSMVQAWEAGLFDEAHLGAPHLTVHDELDGSYIVDSPTDNEALAELKHVMETSIALRVPLKADGGTGPNWGEID